MRFGDFRWVLEDQEKACENSWGATQIDALLLNLSRSPYTTNNTYDKKSFISLILHLKYLITQVDWGAIQKYSLLA